MRSIHVFAKLLNPLIPLINEIQIRIYPLHVFIDILRKRIRLEQFSIQLHPHFRIVIRYAILQEEEIDIALEIDEQFEEPLVLLQTP